MIFGAILAGGVGSRMRMGPTPKQFLPLGDRPVLIHTLEAFLACDRFSCVYIGVHADWLEHARQLVAQYVPAGGVQVRLVSGGSDRNETIQNIIRAIEADWGADPEHIIVSHDAVRPFLTQRIIEENIDAALKYGATDTVTPAADTIVVSRDGQTISDIPDRRVMYQGQTPQSFRVSLLKELYASLSAEEKATLTDACKICVIRSCPVYLVEGDHTNMKITTQGDYEIAQAIVAGRKHG